MTECAEPFAETVPAVSASAVLPSFLDSLPAVLRPEERVCCAVPGSVPYASLCPRTSCSVPNDLAGLAAGRWPPTLVLHRSDKLKQIHYYKIAIIIIITISI